MKKKAKKGSVHAGQPQVATTRVTAVARALEVTSDWRRVKPSSSHALEVASRRARVAELAASGKDLRECEALLKEEGFLHADHSTIGRDLKRERDRLNQATQLTVARHREKLTKNLLALETVVRSRGLQHDDYVPDLLAIFNQLAKLVGANADQRVTVAVETDPKQMKLYQRFLWESRGVAEADFEKVWQLLASLAKPLGVIDSSCLPPRQDEDEAN
jgi:hypothetical protein